MTTIKIHVHFVNRGYALILTEAMAPDRREINLSGFRSVTLVSIDGFL